MTRRQLDTLNQLLALLAKTNRFYQPKIEAASTPPPFASLEAFFDAFPTTTKAELVADQTQHGPHGTNLTFPMERYTRFHQTSGTSGSPMRWLDTPESWSALVDSWITVLEAAGVGASDRVCFAFSFGPFLGFWTAFEAACRLGALALPAGGLSSAARVQLMRDNKATILCCTPTYALRLGETAAEKGGPIEGVRRIIVAGEPGAGIPEVRARIEGMWPGARVFDHHGMTEVGPVSYGDPERPHILRIIESAFIAEVRDPNTGRQVSPGETGELILTTLRRDGSPLLRYRTGDLVRPAADAPDGMANYYLDGGILGRIDDMVLVRGVNVFPSSVESVVRRFPVAEYRVLVSQERGMTELDLEIEADPSVTDPQQLVDSLEEAFREVFSLRIPVRLAARNQLPRFEMKAKRWSVQS